MDNKKIESTPSGTPIYRYEPRSKPFEAAVDSPDIGKIEEHIEKHIGKIGSVYHELVSDLVHIDVFIIQPTPNRNFITLITSGMSDRPMEAPPEVKEFQYAELMICLPPDWPLHDEALKDEKNYWPIRQLKMLARFPHEHDTWLWYGHTIPNGNPQHAFASNTKLSGIIIAPPMLSPKEFFMLEIDETKTIYFFCILPLHKDEMNTKLRKGSDDLFEHFEKQGVNELLNTQRPSVYKKVWWPF
jgi:hypothetical protein